MTKKRRSRKGSADARRRAQQVATPQVVSTANPKPVEETRPVGVDFSTEYHYVVSDLRRFGILAVAMFATLIVLALVLG